MKSLVAFVKKEWLETVRSGKLAILVILFVIFGIMNPAIAKLTPWLMKIMADSLAETGLVVTTVQVDALTSWTQFFKNIPMGLLAFVLIYSPIFTKEYQSGTLTLMLTKGLSRYKVVLAKLAVMFAMWTVCYWLCYGITYGYNAYFWDNGIASNLLLAAVLWWFFGVWIISLMVFFSVLFRNNTGVLLGTGGTLLAVYLIQMLPKAGEYMPAMLMNSASLLTGGVEGEAFLKALIVTVVLCVLGVAASIPIMNKKQI